MSVPPQSNTPLRSVSTPQGSDSWGSGKGVLVFGRTGQVARELSLLAPEARFLGRDEVDLCEPSRCAAAIYRLAPKAVINAAAYTAVDRAEAEEALAFRINAEAPRAMAEACAALAIPFLHLSTDYVFDGTKGAPYSPDDPPCPLNAYGRSKLAGEEGIRAAAGAFVILRTSWVFSAHGQNFVKTMLRLGAERAALRVVADQFGGPTPAESIARASLAVVGALAKAPEKAGTYHFSGSPDVSWAEFARVIMESAGLSCQIEPILSHEYPTAAVRPLNSRLECSATERVFGLRRPSWHESLRKVLQELGFPR